MTLLFWGLVSGVLIGWGSCDLHFRAQKDVVKAKHKTDLAEMQVEIDRARAQVARLIDTSSLSGTKANLGVIVKLPFASV